jgi:hypothetical protein
VIARIELSSDSLNLGAALALTNPQLTLLTLFHRGSGPAEAAVPPACLVDVPTEMEAGSQASPATGHWSGDPTAAMLDVRAPDGPVSARRWRCAPTPESHVERRSYDLTSRTEVAAESTRMQHGSVGGAVDVRRR